MAHKILVTGAGGYIGSVTAYLLLQKGYEVVGIDNLSTGFRGPAQLLQAKFGGKYRFYEQDTKSDLTPLFDKEPEIDAVLHFAASLSVNESMQDPAKYFSNNLLGTQNLIAAMLARKINTFVFSSTCAVYGDAKTVPISEDHPTNPKNPYGESKRMVEKIIAWYSQLLDFRYVSLRYFNVCGATDDGLIGDAKKPSVHLMQNAVRSALGIEAFKLTCPKVETPDGTPIRDYVNVVDLAVAHVQALEYLAGGGKSEIINLGTGTGNSVLEIVKKVEAITGKKIEYSQGEARAGEYAVAIAATAKAKQLLGWEPTHSLEDSVKSLVKWYTSHPRGWEIG